MSKLMWKIRNRKWANRFYYYLFSYTLLVVTLLSFISYIVYQSFITTLRTEIENSTVLTMSKIKDEMDTRIGEMNRMALQITSNWSLSQYKVSEDDYAPYNTVNELKKYKSTNLFINDIILYYNCANCTSMYAASGTYDTNSFFDRIYKYKYWNLEQFLKELTTMVGPIMRPHEQVSLSGQSSHISTYVYPITENSTKPNGAILFLINERTMNQFIQNVLGNNQGFVYIFNGSDIIAEHSNVKNDENSNNVQQWIQAHSITSPVSEAVINGLEYTLINVKSNYNDWSYITVMPSEQVMAKVDHSRSLFNWAIGGVFLLGIMMAILFSARNYRPFKKLTAVIWNGHHLSQKDLSKKSNEIESISDYISYMNKEYDNMLTRLQSQARIVREQSIIKMIKGNVSEFEKNDSIAAIPSLHLDKSYFIVLLFLIDENKNSNQQYPQSMQDLIKYSLINATEELSLELGTGLGAELSDDQGIVVLLNLNEKFAELENVKDLVGKVKKYVEQEFLLTLTVSIGDMCSDYSNIHQSFVQAKQAMRYRFIKGSDQVICYSELKNIQNFKNWYPLELEADLLKAIKQGNSEEVQTIISGTMDNIAAKQLSLEAVEFICFDIANTMMKALIELNIETDQGIEQALEKLYIPRFETLKEMEGFVIDFCRSVCNRIGSQKESKNITLLENIKAYLNNNFRDNTIDLVRIADTFGISASYATRFFKDHTDYSIMRYIDHLRMTESKKLIGSTELSLSEIMSEVGYVDSNNFIRKFKKIEGVTPMEYRKISKGI